MPKTPRSPLTVCLVLAIFFVWCWAAVYLDQPLFAVQQSAALMQIGAADGGVFSSQEWWRLLASQFLHVHFLHMVSNGFFILVIGAMLEQKYGWRVLAFVYVVGGTAGQLASVLAYPDFVSSGASQALMALCGAGVVLLPLPRARLIVLFTFAVQISLDLYVAQTIKVGHGFGFGAGLLLGIGVLFIRRARSGREFSRG